MRIQFVIKFLLWKIGIYGKHGILYAPNNFKKTIYDKLVCFEKPHAVWINHSSFLIRSNGISLLTDPIWSKRCSPIEFIGPARHHIPSMEIENLPRIGFVLISHDHYDHLDEYSVLKLFHLFPNIYWIIPQGLKGWFEKRKIKKDNIIELNWWERVSLAGLDIHAVPTQHFSGRGFFDFNKTRCNGYVIDFKIDNKKCYFAGDTGYNASDFKSIGDRFNKIDLSLIPIGAYEPNMLMRQVHINPKEAVLIHQDVKSIFSLGMHWKTFTLSEEPMHNPPYELHLALKQHNIDPKNFLAIDPGVYVNW